MNDELTPESTLKERQIEAASQRIEFWKMWLEEGECEENNPFYQSRLNHWVNALKALDLEP